MIAKYFLHRDTNIQAIKFSNLPEELDASKKLPRLFCLMSDLHIGKSYDRPIFGRGFNKDIARERFQQMAKHICRESHAYDHLTILCGGDLTESIMENGLHNGIHKYMDLFQD